MILEVNNSFSCLHGAPREVSEELRELLTYREDFSFEKNRLFYLIKELGFQAKAPGVDGGKARQKLFLAKKQLAEIQASEIVCWYDNGRFPTGLLALVQDCLASLGAVVELKDCREVPSSGPKLNLGFVVPHHTPRYYQQEMINLALAKHRGVFVASVGSGKTLVMHHIIEKLNVPTLIVVPSKALKEQHICELHKYFGAVKAKEYDTTEVRKRKKLAPIRLATIQTLSALKKTGELDHLLEGVDCILLDEFHHAGAASYTEILSDFEHIYYRFGFTGTFTRQTKLLDMYGVLSHVLYRYTPAQGVEDGFLTPLLLKIHKIPGIPKFKYQTEFDLNYSSNKFFYQKIQEIVTRSADKQILVLVNRKEKVGEKIFKSLHELGIECTYVSGDDKPELINQAISEFNQKSIKVLIGSQVIGEGVDVCSTDVIIMAQGGKSEVVTAQAVGRAIRKFPGKESAILHDFLFEGTKHLTKHLALRANTYAEMFNAKELAGE